MKRKVCLLLSFIVISSLIFCFGLSANAKEVVESGSVGDNVTWELYDNSELVISGTGDMYDYDNSSSFSPLSFSGIEKVVIEEGVTSIGNYAFEYCYNLKKVTIADSVTSIGDRAFAYCHNNLRDIAISDSVTNIGHQVFLGCSMLTNITVDANNKYYSSDSYGVLFNKDKTRLVACPAGSQVSTYVIPDGVTAIETGAFYGYSKLVNVTLPDSITSIGIKAFQACVNIKNITIPDNIVSIEDWTFSNCYSLTSVTIPDSVTSIGERAFWACSELTDVTIPDSVTYIGDCAFSGCSSFTRITIPDSVTTIDDQAFYYCNSATSITIGENVSVIGFGAFWGCKSIESIYIPASVTDIDSCVFSECDNLKTIEVDINNKKFTAEDGVLFNKNKTELLRYPVFKDETKYIVPESVATFDYYAFEDCINIEEVIIKGNITSLGSCLFQDCKNLKRVEFLGRLSAICNSAFENCVNLSEITIPESVKSIEFWAFRNCQSLRVINIPQNVEYIGENAFASCNELKYVYYSGTEEQWNNIQIMKGNEQLDCVSFNFDAECEHEEEGFDTIIKEENITEPTYTKNGLCDKIVICKNCGKALSFEKSNIPALWLAKISYDFDDGVLIISGSDKIPNLDSASEYPWSQYGDSVNQIIFDGITAIGTNAFENFYNLNYVIIDGENVKVEREAFKGCSNLSVVVSYASLRLASKAVSGNVRPIKYFVEADSSYDTNIKHIAFSFVEEVIGDDEIKIDTYKTVINGEVSLTESEFKALISALYYGSDNNFVSVTFNKLIAEDFYIYEYTSLSPLEGREVSEVSNAKIFAIVEIEPGSGEYISLTMEDFCDVLASGEFDDIDYKFAVLAKNNNPETDEEEPGIVRNIFGTVFEAINKVISLIKRLFSRK